ncbi:TonB-dependent receptor [Zobellia galactanivorans]|uniref:TonB-dependent receptor family protein n=1 Tax=Zobellia galactanivorans (strain DSM 12802 / CCUG 47099 / CIP 106680 / NCIMB 13871 / Dsij) TaxID=63186 RepID=UPI001C0771D3|nr:TonB-dependent receptor [Zobellia galactanivorans]MBU3028061.1 TonB-dependent receptor [Zobellia galactanivorans]MDO6808340.1 TonB-dependent receptor [Zobellia galactanivorans]
MKHLFFVFLSFLLPLHIHAQDDVQKDRVTILDEIVLTDTLTVKNATGIVASSLIGPKTFQNYSPVDMVSAINQIPGVFVLSGALNTNRITIRGIGARSQFGTDKLHLYYNDIPITNGTGASTIEAYDLENLEAIEVIKGPKGTAYGAGLGGAIILVSEESDADITFLNNKLTVGSYGLLKDNLKFSHTDSKLSLQLQYGHMENDGYRENNAFERDGILLNASYKIKPNQKISVLLNHIDYSAEIPSSLGQTAFETNPKQADFTWNAAQGYEANKYTLAGLSYTHDLSPHLKNSTSIFYTYLDHYEPRPFNILDEITNGYGFRTRFYGTFDLLRRPAEYTFGGELYKDEYQWATIENLYEENNGKGSLEGSRISDNKEFRRQFNVFGTLTLALSEAFKAQFGLNINKTHYDFRDKFNLGSQNKSAKRDFNTIALPSLNLNYRLPSGLNIFANISKGFSNPSLEKSLTPDGVINPDIAQETGTNYEVGGDTYFLKKKLYINIALYRMNIKNLLVDQRIGEDQYIGKNAGSTRHQGIDSELNYTIEIGRQLRLRPFFNYTLSDFSFMEFIDGDNDYSGNPLTGVPKHRISSGLQIQLKNGFFWNTTYQYVDKISLTDANTLYSAPFQLAHMKIGYRRQLSDRLDLGLNLGVNNIFDTAYAQSVLINATGFGGREPRYFYPGNGRNWYGGLNLKLKL